MHWRFELCQSDEVSDAMVEQVLEVSDPIRQGTTSQHVLNEPAEVVWFLFFLLSCHCILKHHQICMLIYNNNSRHVLFKINVITYTS